MEVEGEIAVVTVVCAWPMGEVTTAIRAIKMSCFMWLVVVLWFDVCNALLLVLIIRIITMRWLVWL